MIIPGNVYVFGENAPAIFDQMTPHAATNSLGRIRIEMEAAYRTSGIRTIVLRAGDFIDCEPSSNWFEAVLTAKTARGVFVAPGNLHADHAWAYLPEVACAAVLLAEKRERLATFEDIPFPGYTLSLASLHRLCETAVKRELKVRHFPWFAIRAAQLFWPMGRYLLEMRYLWSMPHRLDGQRFQTLLPEFRATDPQDAISTALAAHI